MTQLTLTRSRRAIRWAIFAGVACAVALAQPQLQISDGPAVAGPTFRFVAGSLIGGNVVKGAPYSAEAVTDMTQTLADGTHIVQHSTATEYRDSEGRDRREQTLSNLGGLTVQSTPVQAVFISDPVAGVNYSLNPMDHTAMKLPLPPAPPAGGSPRPECDLSADDRSGHGSRRGYDVGERSGCDRYSNHRHPGSECDIHPPASDRDNEGDLRSIVPRAERRAVGVENDCRRIRHGNAHDHHDSGRSDRQ